MRIAVSDYDGTLKKNGAVSRSCIEAILEWRKAGNIFGIATGRDLSLIMHEAVRWNVPFDFLVCVNGAVLYDEKLNMLRSINIPDALIPKILRHPCALASMHYQLCSSGVNKLFIRCAKSYFNDLDIKFTKITFDESLVQKKIQQISLAYATEAELIMCAGGLAKDFKDELNININGLFADLNKKPVNKLTGVLDMLAVKGWSAEGLLAIGDGENDIPMLGHFGGFAISNASAKVTNEAAAAYESVGDMLMDNL